MVFANFRSVSLNEMGASIVFPSANFKVALFSQEPSFCFNLSFLEHELVIINYKTFSMFHPSEQSRLADFSKVCSIN